MDILEQFLDGTPVWVWVLLVYLVIRGVKARRPADTTLGMMAIIPVLFTAWGLYDLVRLYGVTVESIGLWLAGIAAGAMIGWSIVARYPLVADRAAGIIHRPADNTLLPLLLVTFAIKYGFGIAAAIAPDLLDLPVFKASDLLLSGLFTGIFVGKFCRYAWVWRSAAAVTTAPQSRHYNRNRASKMTKFLLPAVTILIVSSLPAMALECPARGDRRSGDRQTRRTIPACRYRFRWDQRAAIGVFELRRAGVADDLILDNLIAVYCASINAEPGVSDAEKTQRVKDFSQTASQFVFDQNVQ